MSQYIISLPASRDLREIAGDFAVKNVRDATLPFGKTTLRENYVYVYG